MTFARRALDARGSAQRVNRNMVVFLAPDAKRMEDLTDAIRDYLAWDNITGRSEELDLTAQQAAQARTRRESGDKTVNLRIADTYHWLLVPVQPRPDRPVTWDVIRSDGARERLAERASDKLRRTDLLRTVHGARSIRYDLDHRLASIWQAGRIRVGDLWTYYCRHPYLPRLADRRILDAGIAGVANELTWDVEAFAVADGYDEAADPFTGLAIPHSDSIGQVTDQTPLVRPDLALAQRDAETTTAGGPSSTGTGTETKDDTGQPAQRPGERMGSPRGRSLRRRRTRGSSAWPSSAQTGAPETSRSWPRRSSSTSPLLTVSSLRYGSRSLRATRPVTPRRAFATLLRTPAPLSSRPTDSRTVKARSTGWSEPAPVTLCGNWAILRFRSRAARAARRVERVRCRGYLGASRYEGKRGR